MYSGLLHLLPEERVKFAEPMKNHTSFKIGGPVDLMVQPENINEIKTVISYCKQQDISFFVFGLGSNILVRDRGIRGIAIKIGNKLKDVYISGQEVYAQAGIRLTELARHVAANALSGLEFAEGIPGSLGGAVVMNAGAYDGEIKDIVFEVEAIDSAGQIKIFERNELDFSYRKSVFQKNRLIVLSVRMKLKEGKKDEIHSKMKEFARRRRERQPLEYPSAGSVFKRPEGFYVGPMIEQLGLKGYKIGGAQISDKHAGFIINSGNAKAEDVLNLIKFIQEEARKRFDVDLQPEIRVIGEE